MPVPNDKTAMAASAKWLTIIGIGEDGVRGLGDEARQALRDAAHVFGGTRHLGLAGELIAGESHAWPHPFDVSMRAVIALRGCNICVLASGDPYFFGVGTTLSRVIDSKEINVIPAPSSFALAAAHLAWSLQDTDLISLHGAPLANLRRHLQPGRQILALTSGSDSPQEIAEYLTQLGYGNSSMTVLEALGGDNEKISSFPANRFLADSVQALNLVAIKVVADSVNTWSLPLVAGLPDESFQHDGQLTKCDIRVSALAALAPRRGELLWDIGAGAGSIAIEWLLSHPAMEAIAIEREPARAVRIKLNAEALGVPSLKIVTGAAPQVLADLPKPDAIFIGGGGTSPDLITTAMAALSCAGRLIVHAVTLEMEQVLVASWCQHGGMLTKLSVSRAQPLGSMHTWRPALPVTQWSWTKSLSSEPAAPEPEPEQSEPAVYNTVERND